MLKIFDLVPGWVYALALVAAGLLLANAGVQNAHLEASLANQAAEHVRRLLEQERKTAGLEALNRGAEGRISAAYIRGQGSADEKVASVTRERDAALERLRLRPSRPAPGPVAAGAVPGPAAPAAPAAGCTGAELFRQDGEFLVREAARGDVIRAEVERIYDLYDSARAEIAGAQQVAR